MQPSPNQEEKEETKVVGSGIAKVSVRVPSIRLSVSVCECECAGRICIRIRLCVCGMCMRRVLGGKNWKGRRGSREKTRNQKRKKKKKTIPRYANKAKNRVESSPSRVEPKSSSTWQRAGIQKQQPASQTPESKKSDGELQVQRSSCTRPAPPSPTWTWTWRRCNRHGPPTMPPPLKRRRGKAEAEAGARRARMWVRMCRCSRRGPSCWLVGGGGRGGSGWLVGWRCRVGRRGEACMYLRICACEVRR
ncbi:uncharacterized protein BKA78DRAFT_128152 [Phyllosticta capitalensis]|uniref:uncharacterized protein n=1 Tax=Phyllosticta capitalensis TaxID=121624 RepID=UPI00312D4EE8